MDQFNLVSPAARRTMHRRAMLAVLLGSSLVMLGAAAMSLAVFTDSAASGGSWTTGTIVLGVTPATTFNATAIMPGDSGSQTVSVANTGTGDLRYAVSVAATNTDTKNLRDQLALTIQAGTCAAPGATLYSGALAGDPVGPPVGALVGSNTQGADPGDRAVLAGATDSLCFAWSFPLASGNGFQNATTSATFTFDAEQVANN